jgi:hypothetical protein
MMAQMQFITAKRSRCRSVHRAAGERGVSTIDLVVTMGIMAILVGISVGVLSTARRSNAQARCAANLRALGIGFSLYLQDYKEVYPCPSPNVQWEDLMRVYNPRGTFQCPADSELFNALGSSYDWRDTGNPQTTLMGRPAMQVAHSDLCLAFDALPEWHRKNRVQVLHVSAVVELIDTPSFFKDMQRSPVGP